MYKKCYPFLAANIITPDFLLSRSNVWFVCQAFGMRVREVSLLQGSEGPCHVVLKEAVKEKGYAQQLTCMLFSKLLRDCFRTLKPLHSVSELQ
jgi:hypothetical protein